MMSGQPAQQTEGVVDVIEPAGPHEYRLEGDTNEKATTGGHGEEGSAPPKALPTAFIRQEGPATPPQAVTHNQPKIVEEEGSSQMVTPLNRLTGTITWIDCPFCRRRTQTRVTKEGTSMQTIAGIVCCLFCLCLACVPCLAGWFEDTHIFCSACNAKVATIPHDGPVQVMPAPVNGAQAYAQVPSMYAAKPQ